MGTGQFQDLNQQSNVFKEKLAKWRNFTGSCDEDEYYLVQQTVNKLLFETGWIDGSLLDENRMYKLVDKHFNDINEYLSFYNVRLQINEDYKLIWCESNPEVDGVSPYRKSSMSINHLILLSVLIKRFITNNSSKDVNDMNVNGVLVSKKDIIEDMSVYMKDTDDYAKICRRANGAINSFCAETGYIKSIWDNKSDDEKDSLNELYRISPFIVMKFNVNELDEIIGKAYSESKGNAESNDLEDNKEEDIIND